VDTDVRRPQPVQVRVGVTNQQFGSAAQYRHAAGAVERILAHPLLYLVGLHCHIGSQVTDPSLYGDAIRQLVPLMAEIRARHGVILTELNIGGGQGVPYVAGDAELDLDALGDFIDDALDASCAAEHFPRPAIVIEPGRAISARAGVTLYRVLQVQSQPGGRTSVVVDGGLSDNPRVARYDARYSVALANRHPLTPTQPMTVVGRHCESGDDIARDVALPADLRAGDLLAVACTGAYHRSPLVCRPHRNRIRPRLRSRRRFTFPSGINRRNCLGRQYVWSVVSQSRLGSAAALGVGGDIERWVVSCAVTSTPGPPRSTIEGPAENPRRHRNHKPYLR
jgi:diaminopimelate decarboxylase